MEGSDWHGPEAAAPSILVVDDTPANLATIEEHLSSHGYQVAVAEDGEEALKRAARIRPDLVLLDVMMPGIDGFETCRRLKAMDSTCDAAVIFMSALSEVEDKLAGFEAGGVEYITKPFQAEEFLARVRIHLTLRATQKQLEGRTRQLQKERRWFKALLESINAVPWEIDLAAGTCTYIGPQVEAQWGWPAEAFAQRGFFLSRICDEDRQAFAEALTLPPAAEHAIECRVTGGDGLTRHIRSLLNTGGVVKGEGRRVRGISIDITRQRVLELQLRKAQKLESVGRLAAGVAHEINTPLQYISDNLDFVRQGTAQLHQLVAAYRAELRALAAGGTTPQQTLARLEQAESAAELDYLMQQMPDAMDGSAEGLQRVTAIVRSIKEFAHPGQKEGAYADLNQMILGTLNVARNEICRVADVETGLAALPPVHCKVAELNRAVLNILVNAAHAIEDAVRGSTRRGRITVRTEQQGGEVLITVTDTGSGIPEEIRERIFDPFFTTKEVGRGTGQGLAIARSIVVESHRGALDFTTRAGCGTSFIIRLPVHPEQAPTRAST